jgi:hypothetical protein
MTTIADEDLLALVTSRARITVDQLDYRRALARAALHHSQVEVARVAGIKQSSVSSALKTAVKVAPIPPGFSGASPLEICQRYAAGFLDRAQVLDELTRWQYVPSKGTDGYDDLIVDPPGTFGEVEQAFHTGLIDVGLYEEIFNALVED